MKTYETKNFLFCSNMPRKQVIPYAKSLDKMHSMMCKMYGIKKDKRVWLGKALVFAFIEKISSTLSKKNLLGVLLKKERMVVATRRIMGKFTLPVIEAAIVMILVICWFTKRAMDSFIAINQKNAFRLGLTKGWRIILVINWSRNQRKFSGRTKGSQPNQKNEELGW